MKKTLAIALVLAGSSAFGSIARMTALQSPAHVQDVITVFNRPSDMMYLPEAMAIDFGYNGATPAVGDKAEGGMIKAMGDARLGFFVGVVDQSRTGTYLGVENPFSIAYGAKAGDINWAVVFNYASSDKKVTTATTDDQKQSYMGLTGSAVMGDITFGANLGLADTAQGTGTNEASKYSRAPLSVFGQYAMGDWTAHGTYAMATTKNDASGTDVKTDTTNLTIGAINSMKKEGADFFYGVAYTMGTTKVGTGKTDTSRLPVLIGIEADAASWLTLRGSVKQNVLLGSDKTTETDSAPHDTTVAAGAGLKFNKAVLDFTLTAGGTGNLNASIGGNAGLTYLF
jgi:hypothetical protein